MKIKEKILKEIQEEGEANVEGFTEEMLQFSKEDISGYLDTAIKKIMQETFKKIGLWHGELRSFRNTEIKQFNKHELQKLINGIENM